jgi:hypothetical protein
MSVYVKNHDGAALMVYIWLEFLKLVSILVAGRREQALGTKCDV